MPKELALPSEGPLEPHQGPTSVQPPALVLPSAEQPWAKMAREARPRGGPAVLLLVTASVGSDLPFEIRWVILFAAAQR